MIDLQKHEAIWEDFYDTLVAESRASEPRETLLVSAADKLYNARAIVEDYRRIGPQVWSRFKRGREQQLKYFDRLIEVYEEKCPDWRIVEELKRTVSELTQLSASESS